MRPARVTLFVALIAILPALARAQSGLTVTVSDIVDDRISSDLQTGSLQLQMKVDGAALKKASAARLLVKEAKDNQGTDLAKGWKAGDFRDRDMNGGALELSLTSPPRTATSVHVKGSVELFVPSADPAATVTIPKALSKLDSPLTSPGLTAAKIKITPLSAARYAEEKKKQKITDKDLDEIRAQGKAHGASDKEIELAIGLAKAMQEMGGDAPPENAVILSGSTKDFDRIHSIEILGPDKKPVNISSRSTSSRGDSAVMILQPDSVPAGASMRLTLLTAKSKVSVPFELKKVDLP
jgi:hypothetical protein